MPSFSMKLCANLSRKSLRGCHGVTKAIQLRRAAILWPTRNVRSQGDEWYSFAVLDQSCGRFLGGVGINFINRVHQFANLGYWVRTSAAGRGVAKIGRAHVELQSPMYLVCRLLLEKKKKKTTTTK